MKHVDDASTLPVTWWKSSASEAASQCVECGIVSHDEQIVAIRDSKAPSGPALLFTYDALAGLVGALRRDALK
ncbi:DUF397 domain-containing protein [Streptomyces sp. VNUA116]|uniref:DUF397 domain-containing protein n=1 Tax=Streptomyces sp. VNUA116 TaxID=3062449 RepID=UPI002676F7F3|nr:DUF397 domain-containing protein [Streptomyces sp. VNUA116]WKU45959.1 DUF397 domain-containing protein [Streptomyces sp. VNUA116]